MSSLFEQACRQYFTEKLGQEVVSVSFEYDPGFSYSSYTYEDPAFKITVWGADHSYYLSQYENTTAGEFLTELFEWESKA